MIYNSTNKEDVLKATQRMEDLISKGEKFELKKVVKKRTYKQNRYLHLLLGLFSLEIGYTLEESKFIFKKINQDLFAYEKNKLLFYKSTANLDKKEMTNSIEKFKNFCAKELGLYLPDANEIEKLNEIDEKLKNNVYDYGTN